MGSNWSVFLGGKIRVMGGGSGGFGVGADQFPDARTICNDYLQSGTVDEWELVVGNVSYLKKTGPRPFTASRHTLWILTGRHFFRTGGGVVKGEGCMINQEGCICLNKGEVGGTKGERENNRGEDEDVGRGRRRRRRRMGRGWNEGLVGREKDNRYQG